MGRLELGVLVAALLAAAVTLADRKGYARGHADAVAAAAVVRADLQRRIDARGADLAVVLAELEAARAARADLVERLENAAISDPGADRPGLSYDGMQRLGERWGRSGE